MYEETGLNAQICSSLGWTYVNLHEWPGPMVQFMFEAEITGGALKSSQEGRAALYPLKGIPPISSRRLGSLRAMQAYMEKLAREG